MEGMFSFSFMLTIAITCIIVATTSFLLFNRLQQYAIQLDAMMDLVTTVVDEVNKIKGHVGIPLSTDFVGTHEINKIVECENGVCESVKCEIKKIPGLQESARGLINVSDNEDEEEDEDSDEEDEDEDSDEEDEEDQEDEEDEQEEEDESEDEDEDSDNDEVEEINITPLPLDIKDISNIDVDGSVVDTVLSGPDTDVTTTKIIDIDEGDTTLDFKKLTASELKQLALEKNLIDPEHKSKKFSKKELVQLLLNE